MKVAVKKQVIFKPIVSEKSLRLYNNFKVCTFVVSPDATKKQVEYSFEEVFGVKPEKIRVVMERDNVNSRHKKTYQVTTKRKASKKAYITIGDNKLDIFENIK